MITSRNPGWHELATPVEVDVFDGGESIALLRRRAPQLTDDQAGWVAEELGDLSLALAQAGAHLADTTTGVRDYLALLTERTTESIRGRKGSGQLGTSARVRSRWARTVSRAACGPIA